MASNSTIAKQVISELETVQNQLNTFKGNVAYLTDAKNQIENAKKALQNSEVRLKEATAELSDLTTEINQLSDSSDIVLKKIDSIDFPDRLERIENAAKVSASQINKTREATVNELKALAEKLSDSSKEAVEVLDKTAKIAVKEVRDLNAQLLKADIPGTLKELKVSTEKKLTNTLEAVAELKKDNLPAKLVALEDNNKKYLGNLVAGLNANIGDIGKLVREINFQKRFQKIDEDVAKIQSSFNKVDTRFNKIERENQQIIDLVNKATSDNLKKQTLLIFMMLILFVIGFAIAGYFYIRFGKKMF
jgi:prefoldin subunit 5